MASTGLFDDGKKGSRRPAAPYLRLPKWSATGWTPRSCSASGGRRVSATQRSPAFCRHYPKRQIGLACLPSGDIDAAVCEIHRVSKFGLRGVELSNSWDMEPMWPPCCEPLWKAVNEINLPLHFYTFPSPPQAVRDRQVGLTCREGFLHEGGRENAVKRPRTP